MHLFKRKAAANRAENKGTKGVWFYFGISVAHLSLEENLFRRT